MNALRELIDRSFEERAALAPGNAPRELLAALDECLALLGSGQARVAEPADGGWRVNEWLKKAVLLYFRAHDNALHQSGVMRFFDKVPLKYADYDAAQFRADGARVVPGAIVRARRACRPRRRADALASSTSAPTSAQGRWSTPGRRSAPAPRSASNVHLSGGVGIGGVLEPLQAQPTIIEDDCFIGARSEVVEGVIVERGSVLVDGRLHRREHADLRPRIAHRSPTAACPPARSSSPATCPPTTARTPSTAPSSSRKSTRRPARRPRSTSSCGCSASGRSRGVLRPGPLLARAAGTYALRSQGPVRYAARDRWRRSRRARGGGVLASERVSSGGVCERETPPDRRARRLRTSAETAGDVVLGELVARIREDVVRGARPR